MAATCNYDSILQAIVSAISGLGLTLNGATIPVTYLAEPSVIRSNLLGSVWCASFVVDGWKSGSGNEHQRPDRTASKIATASG